MIKVTDDGEGMSHADAPVAFQRHATSKLRTEEDLSSIETMGFRGEALPSIASVSRVRVRTASRTDSVGTQLFLTGGLLTRQEDIGGAPGTQVEVTDLFFNTPARKKFLKTTVTEFSHVCQVVQRSAIAWPRVQFRLKHNSQDVLDYSIVDSRYDRILQVYGPRVVGQMTAVRSERPGICLEGMTVKAVHARATRSPQELFVNRRPVRNTTVTHAVYDGYGSSLAKGCHPVYVLCLEIEPMRVDVNVHPAKREVRFADQDLIHQTIRQAIREAVGAEHPVGAQPAQWFTGGRKHRNLIHSHHRSGLQPPKKAVGPRRS
jgi:DNA mismatch repair protein MutL